MQGKESAVASSQKRLLHHLPSKPSTLNTAAPSAVCARFLLRIPFISDASFFLFGAKICHQILLTLPVQHLVTSC